MKTLSAKEIIKREFKGAQTWKADRTVKVGKVNTTLAYEIVYQPSHEESGNPYKVTLIRHTPERDKTEHRISGWFPSLSAALQEVKNAEITYGK
jgi:hypothetical protein